MLNKKNRYILLILLLTIVFFHKLILNPGMMIYSDLSDLIHVEESYKFLKYNTFKEYGEIPLWNPYVLSDSTFVGSMMVGLFYPVNLLDFIIDSTLVANFQFMLHIFLFGLFVYLYMRTLKVNRFSAFISAIIAMFSGKIITEIYAGHTTFPAFVWLPLAFLFLELAMRKKSYMYSILAGAVLAIQLLGSHPQYLFYGIFSLGMYFIFMSVIKKKSYIRYFLAAMIVFSLLASIQIIPYVKTFQFNARSGGVSWEYATDYSLPPLHLIKLIVPNMFGSTLTHTYWGSPNFWESTGYLGITALILSLLAFLFKRNRYVLFFSGLAVFCVIFSLGKYTPLFYIFYKFVPLFNVFRAPTRMLQVYTFAIAVLAGFGTEFLSNKIKKQDKKRLAIITRILIITSIAGLILSTGILINKDKIIGMGKDLALKKYQENELPYNSRSLDYYLDNVEVAFKAILKDMFVLLSALVALTFLLILKNRTVYWRTALVIIILFELWSFGMPFIDVANPSEIYGKNRIVDFLLQDKGMFRVMDIEGTSLQPHVSIHYGITHMDAFVSVALKRYTDLMEDYVFADYSIYRENITEKTYSLLPIFNTKYIITKKTIDNPGYELVYKGTNHVFDRIEKKIVQQENVNIYKNKDVLPRAYIMPDAVVMKNEQEIIKTILYDKTFDPKKSIIIEKDIKKPMDNEGEFKEAKISFYSPNKLTVEADMDYPGFLILSEVNYPGWKAYENNKEYEIYQTNYLFRSIYLEKGRHKIDFVFDPGYCKLGKWISFITLVILITLIILNRKSLKISS